MHVIVALGTLVCFYPMSGNERAGNCMDRDVWKEQGYKANRTLGLVALRE